MRAVAAGGPERAPGEAGPAGERVVARLPVGRAAGARSSAGPAGGDPPPQARPAATARPRGRHVLDRERLLARGFLDPLGGRTGLGEELRLVKRTLLERAFAPAAVPRDRIVAVTSALPGEGKTFLSVNLALSLSLERDARVLLLDADPVKAAAVEVLGLPRAPGLAELLGPQPVDPAEVLVRTTLDRLVVMAPGAADPRFTELLTSRRMRALVQAILAADPGLVLVVDTPPLLASSEAQALAHQAGQTVLVVGAMSTPRQAIDRALALVTEHTEVQLLLNRAPGRAADAYAAYVRGEPRAAARADARRLASSAGAAAGWLALLAPPVALGNWQAVPRIELATAVTDNVKLQSDDQAQSDVVGSIGAGVRLASDRGALRGRVDYSLKQLLFLETSSGNALRHSLDGAARATLVDDSLYLDLAGDVGDVFESGRELRPRSEFNDLDERTTRISGSVSPFLTRGLGALGQGTLRYRYTEVDYLDDESLSDARAHTAIALVTRPAGVERIGWTAALAADRADLSRSFNTLARQTETGLATLDLNVPVSASSGVLAGLGWSYLADETLGDGGGGAPYWRVGAEQRLGSAGRLRATVGQVFGETAADARLDLELAPRTVLRAIYEQGLRTRFDDVRTVLTDPERLSFEDAREPVDADARERARLLRELTPRGTVSVDDEVNEVKRGRLSLTLERERTGAVLGGYLQSLRPEAGGNSNVEGGVEFGLIRRLDRRHEVELRLAYDRRRVDEDETTADDLAATLVWRRRIGQGARIELGYDFLRRYASGDADVTASTLFVRAVKEL